jgi:hypothetical protein
LGSPLQESYIFEPLYIEATRSAVLDASIVKWKMNKRGRDTVKSELWKAIAQTVDDDIAIYVQREQDDDIFISCKSIFMRGYFRLKQYSITDANIIDVFDKNTGLFIGGCDLNLVNTPQQLKSVCELHNIRVSGTVTLKYLEAAIEIRVYEYPLNGYNSPRKTDENNAILEFIGSSSQINSDDAPEHRQVNSISFSEFNASIPYKPLSFYFYNKYFSDGKGDKFTKNFFIFLFEAFKQVDTNHDRCINVSEIGNLSLKIDAYLATPPDFEKKISSQAVMKMIEHFQADWSKPITKKVILAYSIPYNVYEQMMGNRNNAPFNSNVELGLVGIHKRRTRNELALSNVLGNVYARRKQSAFKKVKQVTHGGTYKTIKNRNRKLKIHKPKTLNKKSHKNNTRKLKIL